MRATLDEGLPLSSFTPDVRDWFERSFEAPTPAQEQAWPAIATGEHVLISAPTGSGKTLAAFLWGLDRLSREPADHTRLVYVSPLKALAYDVDRNLRAPLKGIGADLSVAIRTGDTPQRERAAMRRTPPDILITTPESLYLILTSQAREMLRGVESVIVDEIHAVASTKRGAHLALTLERLSELSDHDPQRIGLSATQNPLEEVARFMVGPRRTARIVDAGIRKPLDLKIHVPVESMVEPDQSPGADLDFTVGGEATRKSIWPAIYPELLEQVRAHRSTIVFVNSRRGAERLALRLNELAGEEISRAHHGSLAREERTVVEEMLKAGELPCLIATSSLELGIDMGAVDLVLQVESPKSVARGLQRIGRAGHSVGDTSKGRIFPKFRADLLECAVVVKLMREGRIEPTVVPHNALDVLAQQIVAIAASAEPEPVSVDELFALITRTHSYAELSRDLLENVLDMLDGRYPSREFGELRPRIVWDRVGGTIRARKGARQLAVTNAGTIPDRGLFSVVLPDGRRVGELDEEMVYEARAGQTFLLGASTWRIEEIGRDRVIVTPAPGVPGAVPFWKGDSVGRPKELGREIGAFSRWAVDQPAEVLERDYDLDALAARNLVDYLREQQDATRVVPSDRTIVIERFRDEIGDWRLCVLSPYGGRIHAAWGLALSRRIREEYGLESDAIWSDDGIIVHLPDADEPPGADLVLVDPDELEDAVVAELGTSALFGARFRENAARSLLIPRAYPGKRTPLWQQRLKSQSLLEVARRYAQFPIVLETYRECLRDVLDLPGLTELLRGLHRRELNVVEVETATASPFASSLLFDYVATYMYEGDTPNAERRAAALSLDRELLRELLGQEELRELIDPGALEQVELDLQHRSDRTRADSRDALADVLRRLGDLTDVEVADRVLAGLDPGAMLAQLEAERRAVRLRVGGEERWIAADDAGLYRDAFGAVAPSGLPEAFMADVDAPLEKLVARFARTHGPFTTGELRDRYLVDPTSALTALERAGELVRGELRPAGSEREWCDPEVLRRLRRASLAVLRKEIEAADQRSLAAFLPSLAGRRPPSGRRRRRRPPARGARPAAGAGAARRRLGARRAAAPLRRLLAHLAGSAVRQRRDRVGRRGRPRTQLGPRGALLPRRCRGHRAAAQQVRAARHARARPAARAPRPRPVLLHRPAGRAVDLARADPGGAVGPRVGRRGDQRRLGAAARTAPHAGPRPARPRPDEAWSPLRHAPHRLAGAGPGPLVADHAALPRARSSRVPAGARRPSCCSSATASSPASRCWRRASPAASRSSMTPSASSRRSGCAGAATSSRASAARSSPCRAPSSACARSAPTRRRRRSCWPPPIRRSPTALRCRGPSATRRRALRGPPPPAARSAWRAPTSSSPAPSPCSTSSAGARASRCSSTPRTPASIRHSRRWRASSPPGAGASSRSSASTASRWWARAGRRRSSSSGSAPARASSP